MATHARKTKREIINKYGKIEVAKAGSEGKTFRLSASIRKYYEVGISVAGVG